MKLWRVTWHFSAIVLVLFSAIGMPLAAHALTPTEGINLQVSPLPIELTAKPGTSTSTDLRIRNIGSQTEKLKVDLLSVSEDDNGAVHLNKPKSDDEWTKWVSFDRPVFNAPSNEWQTVKMTVNVPKSAAFGYYFAVEYLRADQEALQPGKAVTHGAVATFILLNADSPGAKREAQLVSFTANSKSYEFLPASFTAKVHSTGNVHVAPYGNIYITKGGKQIGVIDINDAKSNILPHGSRYFTASWNDGFPANITEMKDGRAVVDKNGVPKTDLKWDFSHANRLRFGHYTAHLTMIYDNGQRDVPLEATVQFWVIPWRVIGAVIALIGLIVVLISYVIVLRRRLKHASAITKKAKESREKSS